MSQPAALHDNYHDLVCTYLVSQGTRDFTRFILQDKYDVASIAQWNYAGIVQPTNVQLTALAPQLITFRRRRDILKLMTVLPSATTVELAALDSIPTGALVFNTTVGDIQVYNGTIWL